MNDLLTVSVDFSETDESVMIISRQTEDGKINIINTLTGSVAESVYNQLIMNPNKKVITYGDIYNQFLDSTKTDVTTVEDWRPCYPPYYDTCIDMAIIVWLKDKSQLIYIYKKEEE